MVVFLHGLESAVDDRLRPIGRKARYLGSRFDARLPALDTREAQAVARREVERTGTWRHPFDGYEEAFATPLERARQAIDGRTRLVVGSSFGGAVALRLVHEGGWDGPVLLLAGAGPKLTPYRTLPPVPALLVHGLRDAVVPPEDSRRLAATSEAAELVLVDDEHALASVVNDAQLGAWVRRLVG